MLHIAALYFFSDRAGDYGLKTKLMRIVAIFLILVQIVALCSCKTEARKTKYNAYYFDYFDTATTITGYAQTQEEFDAVCDKIEIMLDEYHRLFNIYTRYEGMNNLVTINDVKAGVHQTVRVDPKIIDLLEFAKELYEKTDGKVNIAMGSVLKIWHNYRSLGLEDPDNAELPDMEKLKEAAEHTDINDIIIDRENSTVFLADPQMLLDVGAIAKGYAVEKTAEYLESQGITSLILNVGGNIRTIGLNGENEPFKAGIENPDREDEETPYIEFIKLSDNSVVTSGSYQRFYTVNGIDYHHIIDPETLMPGAKYNSVSVITEDSGMGDALSTALFLMDEETGRRLVESLENTEAMWVYPDGRQVYSSGFENHTFEYK